MIQIAIKQNEIETIGQACYAPKGHDIVCAGVSTLAQNFIQSVERLTNDSIQYDMKPGVVHIYFSNLSDHAQILKDSFILGLQSIADAYPYYIQIDRALMS